MNFSEINHITLNFIDLEYENNGKYMSILKPNKDA